MESTEQQKRILVVDDSLEVAAFIQKELQHQYFQCSTESSGERAVDRIAQEVVDLVILDLTLPDLPGSVVCERVRKFSSVPIIILSSTTDYETKAQLLDMGANGYVTKPFNLRELVARVHSMLRTVYNPTKPTQALRLQDIVLFEDRHEVIVGKRRILLTKTEFKFLAFLMRNKNIVLSRLTIFEAVWDCDYLGKTNLIDVFAKTIRRKLNDSPEERYKYIRTIRGIGYMAYE